MSVHRREADAQLQDLREPTSTVSLHPATQQRYLSVVENLATAIRDIGSHSEMAEAIRELVNDVIVERTEPGKPVRVKVNGRLAALIGEPVFPESSLSRVKLVARDRYRFSPHVANLRYFLRSSA
jgi:site-specific DNA recombinase